jgi:hypothetical protein
MSETEKRDSPPKPTFEVVLTLGGCHWPTVARRLVEEALHVAEHGPGCRSCWGGAGTSGHIEITHRPDVTEEAYNADLQAWWLRSRQKDTTRYDVENEPESGESGK